MSLINGLSSAIGNIRVPEKVQRLFLETSKEGPASIILPESAVIVGRSAASAKRGGFLEFQERGPEEVVVAVLWLKGVSWLQKVYDKLLRPRLFKNTDYLSPEIAWNKPGAKLPHIDLTPQEMFTKDAAEVGKFLRIKGSRWLFSVGLATWLAAYVVPKLNQLKTNWILKRYYSTGANQPPHPAAPTQPSPSASTYPQSRAPQPLPALPPTLPMPPAPPAWPTYPQPVNTWAYPASTTAPVWPMFGGRNTQGQAISKLPSADIPATAPTSKPGSVKFGSSAVTSFINGLGHFVDQTAYGHILAVDAGITGGRGYVASKRSLFETTEVVFRDAVSLYFYILFTPHVMKALASIIDPALKTSLQIQPKVAEALNKAISDKLAERACQMAQSNPTLKTSLENALKTGEIPKQVLREILTGSTNPDLLLPSGWLKNELRTALLTPQARNSRKAFIPLLEKESAAYFNSAERGQALARDVQDFLTPRLNRATHLNAADIQQVLAAIKEGQGAFQGLNAAERNNLSVAIKQTFRHTAGIPVNLENIEGIKPFAELFSKLPKHEKTFLQSRIQRMALTDAENQANTMLRRLLNLGREHLNTPTLYDQTEALASWLDRAVTSKRPLHELLNAELDELSAQVRQLNLPETLKKSWFTGGTPTPSQLLELEHALSQAGERKAQKLLSRVKDLNLLLANAQAGKPLVQVARENLLAAFDKLLGDLKAGDATATIRQLGEEYRGEFAERLSGKSGRLFSLLVSDSDEALEHKLKELLVGGLQHDSAFLNKAQDIIGQANTSSRAYVNPGKVANMRTTLEGYTQKLLAKLEAADSALTKGETLNTKNLMEDFFKLNRNTHYIVRSVAVAATMLCLGVLVPKMQNALTKKLTGKDASPGIASAEHAQGIGGGQEAKTPAQQNISTLPSSLNRSNRFQAFQRA